MTTDQLSKLNQHPLNQAAAKRLSQERANQLPHLMNILSLTYAGLPDDLDPLSEEGKTLAAWGRPDAGRQGAALAALEGSVEPDEVESLPLPKLAEAVVTTMRQATSLVID